jgi:hypothetical protein
VGRGVASRTAGAASALAGEGLGGFVGGQAETALELRAQPRGLAARRRAHPYWKWGIGVRGQHHVQAGSAHHAAPSTQAEVLSTRPRSLDARNTAYATASSSSRAGGAARRSR